MSHDKKQKSYQLHLVIEQLKISPLNLEELVQFYLREGFPKSKRQIQRDLVEIAEIVALNSALQYYFEKKVKYYYINTKNNIEDSLSTNTSHWKYTKFYTIKNTPQNTKTILLLEQAINEKKGIKIKSIGLDQTGDNNKFEIKPFLFIPLRLIEHRNSYYIAGYRKDTKEIAIFNTLQINSFEIVDAEQKTSNYIKLLEKELSKRFGITKNINEKIYPIKIEIAQVLVDFISQNHWHESQKILKEKNRYYLTLECGINRELMGWLFQWMYNIRVVEPPELLIYYKKTLSKITTIQDRSNRLVYINIFESNGNKK